MAQRMEINGASGNVQTKMSEHLRPFTQRGRYRDLSNTHSCLNERAGGVVASPVTGVSLALLSGSSQNILDSTRLMSLQEDAVSRKISSEVIKRNLYKSVTAPCRRRWMNRQSHYSTSSSRHDDVEDKMSISQSGWTALSNMFQSLPVTPMQSRVATPSDSPTDNKSFFYGFLSRGATPRCTTPEPPPDDDEDENRQCGDNEDEHIKDCRGLADIFLPHPRYITASRNTSGVYERVGGVVSGGGVSGGGSFITASEAEGRGNYYGVLTRPQFCNNSSMPLNRKASMKTNQV